MVGKPVIRLALWISVLGLLLCAASAAPVFASDQGATEEATSPTSDELNEPRAYDGHLISPELGRLEREEREHEEWLASPEAAEQRKASQLAYSDVSTGEAEELLHAVFAERLGILNSDPARFLSDAQLVRSLDPSVATVKSDGKTSLLDASIPVRTEDDEGDIAKVDLSLESTPSGYETANALSEVSLPESAAEEMEVGEEGFAISQAGADEEDVAYRFGDKNVFYPDVLPDTDLIAAPTASGLEIFNLLRSIDSPEDLHFDLDLPENAELQSDGSGMAEVIRGGETLMQLIAPTAEDAQGTQVPITMTVEKGGITLHVAHREGDYAYPILADPIVEDWANNNASWYYGQNAAALTNGAWVWHSNNSNIVQNVCCWGAKYMGLMINMKAAFYGPEQHGAWTYSTPNLDSYIEHAWITPFWRADYSCGAAQPHDYAGFVQEPGEQWNPVKSNEALKNTLSMDGHGQGFAIGMGSGPPGVWSACDRNLYAGGVALWLNDPEPPGWNSTPSIPDTWTDNTALPISVSGNDPGLGVHGFNLYTTDSNGKALILMKEAKHGCSGLYGSRCPNSWATQINGYDTGFLPTGINNLVVIGYDPAGHVSEGRPILLKVDHTAPVINLSGELLSEHPAKFHLDIDAVDGNSSNTATSQSGMKALEIYLDGHLEQRFPELANPPACSNIQQGRNLGSCEFKVPVNLLRTLSGAHTLKIVATDSLNHSTTKSVALNLPKDVTAPKVSLSGPLYAAAGGWMSTVETSVTIAAQDTETGVTEASLYIDGLLSGTASKQSCELGGCELGKTFPASLKGLSQGAHSVKVVVKDAAGNSSQSSWSVNVDAGAPTLDEPSSSPLLGAGWSPQVGTYSIGFHASDAGVGIQKVTATTPVIGKSPTTTSVYSSSCTGQAGSPCLSSVTGSFNLNTVSLPEGTDTVTMKAYDAFSNVSSTKTLTLHVDRGTPQVTATGPLASAPSSTLLGLNTELKLSISDKGSGTASVDLFLDGELQRSLSAEEIESDGGTQLCSGEQCQLSYSFFPSIGDSSAPGAHTFAIVAYDRAGHSSTTFSHNVTLDNAPPTVALSGPLAESIGQTLPASTAALEINTSDGSTAYDSGLVTIGVSVDGHLTKSVNVCPGSPCPALAATAFSYEKTVWGTGPHEVDVSATDSAGNSTVKRIAVEEPLSVVAPECPSASPVSEAGGESLSASQAVAGIEADIPGAVAPSQPLENEGSEGSELDPSVTDEPTNVSLDEQGIDVTGTVAGGGIEDAPAGAFTVGQVACLQPMQTTAAARDPEIVNGDTVVFANSGADTDTIIRPTALGTAIVQHIRGSKAPSTYSWKVGLEPGQKLVSLKNGGVAIVDPVGVDVGLEDVPALPSAVNDPEALSDVSIQEEAGLNELGSAGQEILGEIVLVLSPPEGVIGEENVPGVLKIVGAEIITAELPAGKIKEIEEMIIRANPASPPEDICAAVFASVPNLYAAGCTRPPLDPTLDNGDSETLEGALANVSSSMRSTILSAESDYALEYPGEGAIESLEHMTPQEVAFCYRHGWPLCRRLYEDARRATELEGRLFNVPAGSIDTKANAFKHSYWTALMTRTVGGGSAGLIFAKAHEGEAFRSNNHHAVDRKSSRMDVLNDYVGFLTPSGASDKQSCEQMINRIPDANFLGDDDPFRWSHTHGYTFGHQVFRKKKDLRREGATEIEVFRNGWNCDQAWP